MKRKTFAQRVIPLLLISIMVISLGSWGMVQAQESYAVTMNDVVAEPGDTVTFDVSIAPGSQFNAMQLVFSFDPSKLQYVEPTSMGQAKGEALKAFEAENGSGSMVFNTNNAANGEVGVGYINGTSFSPGGKILKLTFAVKAGAVGTTPVGIRVKEMIQDDNGTARAIATTVKAANVTVKNDAFGVASFTTDKVSGQPINTSIKLTASGVNGSQPYQYKFYYQLGTTTQTIQNRSASQTATFTPTAAGSYHLYVEIVDAKGNTATTSINNFQINEVTPLPIPEPDPGTNIDVEKAISDINQATAGETVAIPVKNSAAIPISLFLAAKGKGIDLVFTYTDYTWTIAGNSIADLPANTPAYDLSVKTINNATLTKLINDPNALQIELSHSGTFAFIGKLTYTMNSSLNGQTVYRYYFDETGQKLDYQDKSIVKDGKVVFEYSHASQYVISTNAPAAETTIDCSYQTHVENIGWQGFKKNGEMSGTYGQSLRLEGIEIITSDPTNLGITYQTHVENIGWQGFRGNGDMSGTSGQSLRLEAIQIKLIGTKADQYDVYYRVHAQNVGWMDWASNGSSAGTAGFGYRLEGIEIRIVPKGDPAPGEIATPFMENNQL